MHLARAAWLNVVVISVFACAEDSQSPQAAPESMAGTIPCAVDTILTVCRHCHVAPLASGAPFALLTLADVRSSFRGKPVYVAAEAALKSRFMPLAPYSQDLNDADRATLVKWFAMGAPAGVACP